jgi:hypothetical protein
METYWSYAVIIGAPTTSPNGGSTPMVRIKGIDHNCHSWEQVRAKRLKLADLLNHRLGDIPTMENMPALILPTYMEKQD